MKKRLGGVSTASTGATERPFFDVSVELSVPRVTMNPTLDDIQAAINATAKKVETLCKSCANLVSTDTVNGNVKKDQAFDHGQICCIMSYCLSGNRCRAYISYLTAVWKATAAEHASCCRS